MCDAWTRWILLVSLLTGIAEFGLRLSTLQPQLRSCPWRNWPRLLWQTVLDDRIHLMGIPSRWRPPFFTGGSQTSSRKEDRDE